MAEQRGDSGAQSGDGLNQYSTADYCESPDSASVRRSHPKPQFRPPVIRCPWKYNRQHVATCCHQPKTSHSFPNRRTNRSGGRRTLKRNLKIEETTSMDERKSSTSYPSMFTVADMYVDVDVDVSREIEAVNRDIEEIIRRCDNYCVDTAPACCLHTPKYAWKMIAYLQKDQGLTGEQVRILTMKIPPSERLTEVPLFMLKSRHPRRQTTLKENSQSTPQTKNKIARDSRDIVEETEALLKNVYKELSQGKRVDENDEYRHDSLERYLSCQNKCRMFHHKRLLKPKLKDILENCESNKVVRMKDNRDQHIHETNCISDPAASSSIAQSKERAQNKPKAILVDVGMNTETHQLLESEPDVYHSFRRISKCFVLKKKEEIGKPFGDSEFQDIDLQLIKSLSDNISGTKSHCKSPISVRTPVKVDSSEHRTSDEQKKENDPDCLLLDRNMGLSLEGSVKSKSGGMSEAREDGIASTSRQDETPDTFLSDEYSGETPKIGNKGAGDSVTGQEINRRQLSQIISKIAKRPRDWTLPHHRNQTTNEEGDSEGMDSDTCLEVIKQLVDFLSRNQYQVKKFGEVPLQYAMVRSMKQQHLRAILNEISSLQDLELYMKNVSVAQTRRKSSSS